MRVAGQTVRYTICPAVPITACAPGLLHLYSSLMISLSCYRLLPVFVKHGSTNRFNSGNYVRRYQRQADRWKRDIDKWKATNPDHPLLHWVNLGFSVHQVLTL